MPSGKPDEIPGNFGETVRELSDTLREVDNALPFADLPQPALESLSDAVDQIRNTLWAVLGSLSEDLAARQKPAGPLTTHHIRRARSVMHTIMEEIDSGNITPSTPEAEELSTVLSATHKKLNYFLHGRAPVQKDKDR